MPAAALVTYPRHTEEAVNRYYGGRTEVTAFRVSDAAISGNAPEVASVPHSFATGTEPIPMLGALAVRIRNIARAPRAYERQRTGA